MNILLTVLMCVASYLLGSIPFGMLISKLWKGIDIRRYGSGNIGTTNVLRTVGITPAVLVLAGDMSKGIAAVMLGRYFTDGVWGPVLCGLFAVMGHSWPVTLKFSGGKGVATTLGVLLGMSPVIALLLLVLWIIILVITRYVSLASVVVAIVLPFMVWLFSGVSPFLLFGIIACLTSVYKHRGNIQRLRTGTEYKIGQRVSS